MKKNLGAEGELFPQSVFIVASYGEDGTPNAMNVAWAGECTRKEVCINIGDHKTTENIVARGAFTVAPADAAHVVEADYFGIETGNRVTDKLGRAGLTASKAETVDAPVVNEFPVCLECEFIEYQADEYGLGVIGRVKNVTADERVMADGKIDISKINAIAFDPYTHGYYKVTERVGEAFKDGLKLKK